MLKEFRRAVSSGDVSVIAVGIAIGTASFYLLAGIASDLIGPLIAAFIGDQHFELNSFTINSSEFRYGTVLVYLISFALVAGIGYFLLAVRETGDALPDAGDLRSCPECTRSIPVDARRCPYCTTQLAAPQSRTE